MKNTILLLAIAIMTISQSIAQDRLFFLNGDETDVKITEVSASEVKYKRMNNLEGPTFSTLKSELFMVKYSNGDKEVISIPAIDSNNSNSEPPKEDDHEINIFNLSTTEPVEGFYPPKKGNSVVYIARWAVGGYAAGFEYFHEDQFIGKFVGNGYLRFECKPGKHLFWASSENKEFITTELEPNRTYIIRAMAAPGAWKMHASLKPITRSDEEDFNIIKNMVNRKPASHLEESKLRKLNNQLKNFIQKELNHYQNVTKDKYNFRHLSADSFIPTELLDQ